MPIPGNRIPIWNALSEFYLDTQLQESDYVRIADIFLDSGLTIKEVKDIDKYEVFPALQMNLLGVTGEWGGFDEEWLIGVCTANYERRDNDAFGWGVWMLDAALYWMRKKHWKKVKRIMKRYR